RVVRKAAVEMLEEDRETVSVSPQTVEKVLGAPRYLREAPDKEPQVGVVNGLAYTAVGGETLTVECLGMPGTGQLQLTGKLGDVMQESAKAAVTYIRAHAAALGLEDDFMKRTDIHIHVPEGAVPKDGPSAGTAILTAVTSALTGIPVRARLAMTGEITLRGRVLAIGGLREKLLAAVRAGVTEVLLPESNRRDLEDVPKEITEKLRLTFVRTAGEVLKNSLVTPPKRAAAPAQAPSMAPVYQDAGRTLPAGV
ncbi:MAG: endopeptidase La, partial [Clostridia bacterium]|nr:endopeptidase La [Clostridia bacterium]